MGTNRNSDTGWVLIVMGGVAAFFDFLDGVRFFSHAFLSHCTSSDRTMVNALLLRISIQPDLENGLQKPSQIMMDKALAVKRDKIGQALVLLG